MARQRRLPGFIFCKFAVCIFNSNQVFGLPVFLSSLLYAVIISIFLLACLVQLGYAFFFIRQKMRIKDDTITTRLPQDTSIIICAKNEAINLQRYLPLVLSQQYAAAWEVLVVNDASTDGTADVLSGLQEQHAHLRVMTIPQDRARNLPGKKYALAEGIAHARYERLLLTDADCAPASDYWLQSMANKPEAAVLGYGAYEIRKGLLNKFIRWETVHTCMQYASYAAAGMAYMGVGRNLLYEKHLLQSLEEDEAFQAIYKATPSGDDDLIISKITKGEKVGLCLQPDACTISLPQETWPSWWRQKTRHMSTGKYYPRNIKQLLAVYGLSHGLYWLSGIVLTLLALFAGPTYAGSSWTSAGCIVVLNPVSLTLLSLFALRLFVFWILSASWYRQLGEKKIFLFYPLGDLGWALYNVFLSPFIVWKNKQAWK